jgi:hypothetical protein
VCWNGISFCLEFEYRKAASGNFAVVFVQLISGFSTLKNEQKPGVQFDKGSAGELQDVVVSSGKLFSCLGDGCDRPL